MCFGHSGGLVVHLLSLVVIELSSNMCLNRSSSSISFADSSVTDFRVDVSERGRTAGSRTKELVREAKGGLSKSFLGNFVGSFSRHVSDPDRIPDV